MGGSPGRVRYRAPYSAYIDLAFKWIDIFNYLNTSKGVQGTVSVSIWVTLFSYASSSTLNPESKRFLK